MSNINIKLTDKQSEFVSNIIEKGYFADASEVFQNALELLQKDFQAMYDLKSRLHEGCKQAERGELHDMDDVFREAFHRAEQNANKRKMAQKNQLVR